MLGSIGLVIVGVGRGGEVTLVALALCLLAALSWAIGNVISRASGSTGGLALTVWSAVVVPVPLLALSPLLDGPTAVGAALAGLSWQALVSTLYTAVLSSLVGYGIFNGLLGRNPSADAVPWILLVPPVAMVSAWLLLGQVPNAAETAGGVLLMVGVLTTLTGSRRSVRPQDQEAVAWSTASVSASVRR